MKSLLSISILGALCMSACSHSNQRTETAYDERREERSPRMEHVSDVRERNANDMRERTNDMRDRDTNVVDDDDLDAPTQPDVTAQDQSTTEADTRITQLIRQNLMSDDDLSMTAQNCTIVTRGGVVSLRGRVLTAAEKAAIEANARRVPGVTRIDNGLEVQP